MPEVRIRHIIPVRPIKVICHTLLHNHVHNQCSVNHSEAVWNEKSKTSEFWSTSGKCIPNYLIKLFCIMSNFVDYYIPTYYMSNTLKIRFPGQRGRTRIDRMFPKMPMMPIIKSSIPSSQNLAFVLNSLYSSINSWQPSVSSWFCKTSRYIMVVEGVEVVWFGSRVF